MSRFMYYPGCSMDSSARAYGDSIEEICRPLQIDLQEIDDWNCCGASEYMALSQTRAFALISRNLALAEKQKNGTDTLVAPCSLCYLNLAKTDHYMQEDPRLGKTLNTALDADGLSYTPGAVAVRHLLDVIIDDIGLDAVRSQVVRPLTGLRLAPYLGCLVTRPDYGHRWRSREHPKELDHLLAALGAEVVDFPLRTDCCGGHMTQISPGTGFELIRRLVDAADRLGADALVTLCPMCQMNVDAYQGEMNRHYKASYHMPVLFFTQLMGIAFGSPPDMLGFGTELVSANGVLAKIGVQPPPVAEPEAVAAGAPGKKHRPKQTGLPMPVMPDDEEGRR
jgi:heterodisulfide reductase subunit B